MGYLICTKCKSYYKLQPGESGKDFDSNCGCGGKLKYVENLDIVDPNWKPVSFKLKSTKREIISEKLHNTFSLKNLNVKNRINGFFYKYFGKWIYRIQNWNRTSNYQQNPYGMQNGLLNSIISELNFYNIRWVFVIPVTIAITLVMAFTSGIFTLLTFALLVALGYLFDNIIISTKNAIIAGTISFFLGSLLAGSFLLLIPFTILGAVNGAVCGWIGGYLKTRLRS